MSMHDVSRSVSTGIPPIRVTVDGKDIQPGVVSGKVLAAEMTDRTKWAAALNEFKSAGFYLFAMPYSESLGCDQLEKQLQQLKGKTIDMGGFPNLKAVNASTLSVTLKPSMIYDLFLIGKKEDGQASVITHGRVTTKKTNEVPYGTTLEEMRLLASLDLGLGIDDIRGLKAKVTPMTAWGAGPGRFIMAGFEFGEITSGYTAGVMVQHNGVVTHYHGYSTEEIMNFVRKTPTEVASA